MTENAKSRCPICKEPATPRYRPFCSRRCSDLDLGRWLKESYVIPGTEPIPDDGESDAGD
ncbi:MAG: DNA gyrase inhibitor YacG [Alphaproteobacteria bacterium]|nr:MAG: DNA gyrase inhibitor YacG [Alphaproteobacteria bacterium]